MGDCLSSPLNDSKLLPNLLNNSRNNPRTITVSQFFPIFDKYQYTYLTLKMRYLLVPNVTDVFQHVEYLKEKFNIVTCRQLEDVIRQIIATAFSQYAQLLRTNDGARSITDPQNGEIYRFIRQSLEEHYGVTIAEMQLPIYASQLPPFVPVLKNYSVETFANNASALKVIQRNNLLTIYLDLLHGGHTYCMYTVGKPGQVISFRVPKPAREVIEGNYRVEIGLPLGKSGGFKLMSKASPLDIFDKLVADCRNGTITFPTPDGQQAQIPPQIPVVNPFRSEYADQLAGSPNLV